VTLKFKPNRFVKTALVALGLFVAFCIGVFAYLADRVKHAQDSGEPEHVAAEIANFTVPKGFRVTHGVDFLIVKQSMLVSTDSANPMTIILQGLNFTATKDAVDQSLTTSMNLHCAKLLALGDDLLTANGALFTLHRFTCVGMEGSKETVEYEVGSFTGKMPTVTIMAFATKAAWSTAPIHTLLKSLH
jgi:hypothetical protein